MFTFALDAMGGDKAPREVVRGAVDALGQMSDIRLILVGRQESIEPLLEEFEAPADRVEVFHCTQVVEMGEKAAKTLRSKPDSSMKRGAELVAEGRAEAVVSAGDTGAQVAMSALIMKLLPGVTRPGIAVNFPGEKGPTTTIDVGANPYCRADHLFEYGIMGSVYQHYVGGVESPRVGLLSIGEERSKGNQLVKETVRLFETSNLNFIGNVEGTAILSGICDVLVCDGFAGNIMLKVSEGLSELLFGRLQEGLVELDIDQQAKLKVSSLLKSTMAAYDYSAYGGAPLFGINGTSIICHGRSNAMAIANAIKGAREFSRAHVTQHIIEELENNKALLASAVPDGSSN